MGASRSRIARIAAWPATFVLMAAAAPSALATDRFVPTTYPTIQAAINASVDGDDIYVDGGTYHENIDLLGKSLLLSYAGTGRVTIDGNHLGPCVTIDSGKPLVYLDGFRLIHGSGHVDKLTGESFGGGVFQTAGSLEIVASTITGCEATRGGAIFTGNGAATNVFNCQIGRCNRKPTSNRGGGIAVADSSLYVEGTTIEDCGTVGFTSSGGGIDALRSYVGSYNTLITRNAAVSGGGMWLQESDFEVAAKFVGNVAKWAGGGAGVYKCHDQSQFGNCEFTYNRAEGHSESEGGGLWLFDATWLEVGYCFFHYNRSKRGGGLATLSGSNPVITHCSFRGNTARMGGGIYANSSDFEASDSIIAENTCLYSPPLPKDGGGGIYSVDSMFGLELCTVTRNLAIAGASGILHSGTPFIAPDLSGSIVWGNGGPGLARNLDDRRADRPMRLVECDYERSDDFHPGSNFQVDPQFDPASFVFDLLPQSPLIDVVLSVAPWSGMRDVDLDPRPRDGNGDGAAVNDCGAQERQ